MIPEMCTPFYRLEFMSLLRAYPAALSGALPGLLSERSMVRLINEIPVIPAMSEEEEFRVLGELDMTDPVFRYVSESHQRLYATWMLIEDAGLPPAVALGIELNVLTDGVRQYKLMHGIFRMALARARTRRCYEAQDE